MAGKSTTSHEKAEITRQKHEHEQLNSVWYIFIYSSIFVYYYHCTLVDPYKAICNCTALYRLIIQKNKNANIRYHTARVRLGGAKSAAQRTRHHE